MKIWEVNNLKDKYYPDKFSDSYKCQLLILSKNINIWYLNLDPSFYFNSVNAQNDFYLKDNKCKQVSV